MCGICGILGGVQVGEALRSSVVRMTETLRHRGPDDCGAWTDDRFPVALGQCRLSIIDLSPAGHQPMTSASGRFTIAFNGEIYNYLQIRDRLDREGGAIAWRGHSDTEVLLASLDHWGLVGSLPLLNGMFAFAAWDRVERALYLARDRMGEKPLYYSWQQGAFLFGSELKALRAHPAFQDDLDSEAIDLYFRFNCIPAPRTIYRRAHKLPPATWICIRPNGVAGEPVPYWSARRALDEGFASRFEGSDDEAITALDTLLRDAVSLRMVSDVALGSFLSGGIDSSLVTALMQAQSSARVRTFSIGSHDDIDEAPIAKAVAAHLGTDHIELYVTDQDARDVIPSLPHMYDEPFADSSQIPTHLLARLSRQQVTVALSGDGGDELFGGYNRHTWVGRIWRGTGWAPAAVRRLVARGLHAVPQKSWDNVFRAAAPLLPKSRHYAIPGYKMHRLAGILGMDSPAAIYRALTAHWNEQDELVLGLSDAPSLVAFNDGWRDNCTIAEQMMYLDSITYLPDDILVKVDRATMAVSLEGRIPFLDHRVYEFSWKLPLHFKLRAGKSKWILRQLLARYVPPALTERAKCGFGVPVGAWLRGPLREWAEDLLDSKRLAGDGILNPEPVRRVWAEFLAGQGSWEYHLWDVLMFQAWLASARRPATVEA